MRKYQIYDENRLHRAILEVFNFLIFAVHFYRAHVFLPRKKPWLRGCQIHIQFKSISNFTAMFQGNLIKR